MPEVEQIEMKVTYTDGRVRDYTIYRSNTPGLWGSTCTPKGGRREYQGSFFDLKVAWDYIFRRLTST